MRLSEEMTLDAAEEPRADLRGRLSNLFAGGDAAERELERRVSSSARDFLAAGRVSSDTTVKALTGQFTDSRMPEGDDDAAPYFDYLLEQVVPHAINTSSPRFIGHMTSALPAFVHQLSRLLTVLNQNVVKLETSKVFSLYERQALAMLHRVVFGLPGGFYERHAQRGESTLGMVTSGGTAANLTALWCARNAAFGPAEGFAGVEKEGLAAALKFYGYEGAAVVGSRLMHYSLDKAACLLGSGTRGLVRVGTDSAQRLDVSELRRALDECRRRRVRVFAVVGVAGTTDCGAVDPLEEMAAVAREEKIHFHVDAAWGGPLLFSGRYRHRLAGVERADSVTVDGHKQLYLPMGIGALVLRDPQLAAVIERQAQYIVRPGSIDLGKRTLEGSRPAMSLYLHAALHVIGRAGYEELVDENIRKTLFMADAVRARAEFELLNEPEMNILNYRYVPESLRRAAREGRLDEAEREAVNRLNVCLQKAQRAEGRHFISRTTLLDARRGEASPVTALRAVIANPFTTEADITAVLDDQVRIAAGLAA